MNTEKPFGMWPSPISPAALSRRVHLDDVQWDSDGQTLVWLQSRSGRSTLVAQAADSAPRELTESPSPSGGVGYGGGDFTIFQGKIYFAEDSGRIYRQPLNYGQPVPITPPYGGVASPAVSPDGRWAAYVFSDGETDLLGLADAAGTDWPVQLARGADFYMQPSWHPGGRMLAWAEWNHPHMPWDSTFVQLAHLNGTPPRVERADRVAGGETLPASQPLFSPDGRWLALIEAAGEWEDLQLIDLQDGSRRVLLHGDGFHLTTPDWGQGQRTFGWSHDSQSLYSIRNTAGTASLYCIRLDGSQEKIDTAPYTWLTQISVSPTRREVALIASGPFHPTRVLRWDGSTWHIAARSDTETLDPAYLPAPEAIQWPTEDGSFVHGLYYPPTSPEYQAAGLPPAILNVHGGPTAQAVIAYNSEAAYFSSRGYAVIEINYRGSSGYGRSYRDALQQHWGSYDVEDAVSCRKGLADQKLADGKRCVIKGGSAGGYTVLNALVRHPGTFKAAVCLFGVSNLFALDLDTHKFEKHYNHSMVGKLPEAADRYHAWSPVFHAAKISDPIIIFQGSADKVVPPSQSDEIVAALRISGTPHRYFLYEGEGHGFRKSENIANYLEETQRFLLQHVLFAP